MRKRETYGEAVKKESDTSEIDDIYDYRAELVSRLRYLPTIACLNFIHSSLNRECNATI